MIRGIRLVSLFCARTSGVILFLIVVLLSLSAVMRYVFKTPLAAAAADIPILSLIMITAFSLAYAQLEDKHVRIMIVLTFLKGKLRKASELIACSITVVWCIVIIVAFIYRSNDWYNSATISPELRILLWPFCYLIILGIIVLILQAIANAVSFNTKNRKQVS